MDEEAGLGNGLWEGVDMCCLLYGFCPEELPSRP